MSFTISVAVRSQLSPPKGFTYIKPCVVKDTVEAPNLQLLAYATEQHIKCGNITKSGSITKSGAITKNVPTRIVYELYPPKRKRERWFCQFIKNTDDKTFFGRWCIANSSTILDVQYAKPVVFEWSTVKCRAH